MLTDEPRWAWTGLPMRQRKQVRIGELPWLCFVAGLCNVKYSQQLIDCGSFHLAQNKSGQKAVTKYSK